MKYYSWHIIIMSRGSQLGQRHNKNYKFQNNYYKFQNNYTLNNILLKANHFG